MLRLIALREVQVHKNVSHFTTQEKRYTSESIQCCRAFITIGKQTNHAKQSGILT